MIQLVILHLQLLKAFTFKNMRGILVHKTRRDIHQTRHF